MRTIFYQRTNVFNSNYLKSIFIVMKSSKHLNKSGLVLADVLAVGAFDVILIDHGVLHGSVNLGVTE